MYNRETLKLIAHFLIRTHNNYLLKKGYQIDDVHKYHNETGSLSYIRVRMIHLSEKKKFISFHQDEQMQWVKNEPTFGYRQKPLYHLPDLMQNAASEVWIVEGEKKVELLEKFGFIATTSGGSTSVQSTNWEPLHDRSVVVWPDNDTSGTKWLNNLLPILHAFSDLKCNT